ncbi:MAG: type II secretion system inner membrane protein GspF [Thiotrichaceae bacterium]|nr:type II secretion system inner membrane protein GspF [Thiotrichaceae bacterium]
MAAFEYTSLDTNGKEITGILEADTARQVRQILRDKGQIVLDVATVQGEQTTSLRGGRIKPAELAVVTRQLATLLEAGSPLEEALQMTAQQTDNKGVNRVISAVRSKVMEGHSLADSFRTFPNSFPPLFLATIEAGEKSGHLDAILSRLADYTESRYEMQQKAATAMYYPIALIVIAIAIVSGLLAYVVPKVVNVFKDMDQELPALTKIVLNISDLVTNYGLYILVIIVVSLMINKKLLTYPEWRYKYDRFLLRVPLIKGLIRGNNTSSFARTLSILFSSGVPILDALTISAQVIQNAPMKQAVEEATVKVREGGAIAKALEQSGYFPPMAVYMIASGENSGKLGEMLERVAQQQERETDSTLARLLALFEPILIVVMGIMVLLIVLAILLPIFELPQMLDN